LRKAVFSSALVALVVAGPAMAISKQQILACQAKDTKAERQACHQSLRSPSARAERVECKKSIKCWARYNQDIALRYCEARLDSLATSNRGWKNAWQGQDLDHVRWVSKKNGVLAYVGEEDGIAVSCTFYPNIPQKVKPKYGPATPAVMGVEYQTYSLF